MHKIETEVIKTVSRSQPFCLQLGILRDLKLSLHASDGLFFDFDEALCPRDLTALIIDLKVVRESHEPFVPVVETAHLLGSRGNRAQISGPKY